MKLYWNPISQHSVRPALLLAELGIQCEKIALDPTKGENRTPQYLALNPMGKIPTLVDDDGFALWESGAINQYLASRYDAKTIWPQDSKARADINRWMFWSTAHFDPPVGTLFWEKFFVPMQKGTPNAAAIEKANKDLERFLPVLNGALEGKQFLTGSNYTLADIHVGAFARTLTMPELGFNLSQYAHVSSWLGRLNERLAWKSVFAK